MWTSLRESRPDRRCQLASWYRRILDAQRRSELSVSEAADQVGVTPATLYSWRRRLDEDDEPAQAEAPGLIRVQLREEEPAVNDGSGAFVLRWSSGRSLEVPSGFDADELARVLEVLETC